MLATLDNSNELLAAVLRPGNAGPTNAADHISVLDAALAQIPDEAGAHGDHRDEDAVVADAGD
jgi:hypothetical protein